MSQRNRVLLIYPDYTYPDYLDAYNDRTITEYPWAPLSVLVLANVLLKSGFEVEVFDQRVENVEHAKKQWQTRLDQYLFVGISSMTGAQIKNGLDFSAWWTEHQPSIPKLWGGVHPSLYPEETLGHRFVDMIMVGKSEVSIAQAARCLQGNDVEGLKKIENLGLKLDGKLHLPAAQTHFMDFSTFRDMPMHLIPLESYLHPKTRHLPLLTSVGCSARCSFCYLGETYRGMKGDELFDTIVEYTNKYNIGGFKIFDPNFFVGKKHILQLFELIHQKGVKTELAVNGDIRMMNRYTPAEWELMVSGGLRRISVGNESGSDKVLETLNKDHRVADFQEFINLVKPYLPQMELFFFYMFGVPGETIEDVRLSINQIRYLKSLNQRIKIGPSFFFPMPKTAIVDLCKKWGYTEPTSLEEWGDIDHLYFNVQKFSRYQAFSFPWTKDLFTDEYRALFAEEFGYQIRSSKMIEANLVRTN